MIDDYNTIRVKPLGGALGAEISGIDLNEAIPDEQLTEVRQVFGQYAVIFFRNQKLTPENEIRFAKRWGEINTNRFFSSVEGYPQIALVVKEPDQKNNIGGSWHTDHSYDIAPALGSMLFAHEVPVSCLLYTSPSPRDRTRSRMPSSA